MKRHRPPHLYLDDTFYTITGSILRGQAFLRPNWAKELLLQKIEELIPEYDFRCYAWVILDDHYHILIKTCVGQDLAKLMQRLHSITSLHMNRRDDCPGRQVWYSYWDTCMRSERDIWTHFNYLHNNPVKHGYVLHWAEWLYSSYRHYLERKGEEWLMDVWEHYPVIDYLEGDDFLLGPLECRREPARADLRPHSSLLIDGDWDTSFLG
jgi:putative transposase